MTYTLGCVEQCLFGALEDKLDLLEELGLWLELANTGPRDISSLDSYSVKVKTVQAYMLHKLHWLSPEKKMQESAYEHILDTIKIAEDIGADHVLTVPTYGFDLADNSRQLCVQNFRSISKETNLVILIEALSPKKTGFLPSLPAVAELVDEEPIQNGAQTTLETTPKETKAPSTVKFSLTSQGFQEGENIPIKYTCDGDDKTPPLSWEAPPDNTKSMALILDDPDAPAGSSHTGFCLIFHLMLEACPRACPGSTGLRTVVSRE